MAATGAFLAFLALLAGLPTVGLATVEDSAFGAAFGAARLGLVAAEGSDPALVCSRPPIAEVLEPQPELVENYQDLLIRYRRLYPALQEEF